MRIDREFEKNGKKYRVTLWADISQSDNECSYFFELEEWCNDQQEYTISQDVSQHYFMMDHEEKQQFKQVEIERICGQLMQKQMLKELYLNMMPELIGGTVAVTY